MSEQSHADLGKKIINYKRIILIIIIAFIIVVSILVILLFRDEFGFFKDCTDFKDSFYIEDVCNLNNEEIQVSMFRGSDIINLNRIKFEFGPSKSLWKVEGGKCSDIRLRESEYGGYCLLIEEEDNSVYVFNLREGKQEKAKIWAEDFRKTCLIGEIDIRNNC